MDGIQLDPCRAFGVVYISFPMSAVSGEVMMNHSGIGASIRPGVVQLRALDSRTRRSEGARAPLFLRHWRLLLGEADQDLLPDFSQAISRNHSGARPALRIRPLTWHFTVGVAGFEPTTSSSRTKRATKLRYTPKQRGLL
jgi:hypothetical protein